MSSDPPKKPDGDSAASSDDSVASEGATSDATTAAADSAASDTRQATPVDTGDTTSATADNAANDTNPATADSAGSDSAKPAVRKLDADGRERPAFLLSFPADPDLDALVAAYERGDFRTVRQDAARVIQNAKGDNVKKAAAELRRRIDPDPLVVTLLGLAIALFLFLVGWAYFDVH